MGRVPTGSFTADEPLVGCAAIRRSISGGIGTGWWAADRQLANANAPLRTVSFVV
jgi:hypothetical protein